jgi:superfamily II DNA or RNA helicase
VNVLLPPIFGISECVAGNMISQLLARPSEIECSMIPFKKGRTTGYMLQPDNGNEQLLLITNGGKDPDGFKYVLRKVGLELDLARRHADLSAAKWDSHPCCLRKPLSKLSDYEHVVSDVLDSWTDTFSYKRQDPHKKEPGLRPPQLGALWAAQSYFTVHRGPATIVMPTGTGKTETMLSILVVEQCKRLLVVVPTDALRAQIANKFLTLGGLKDFGIVSEQALYPVVGTLKHSLKNVADLSRFVRKCNVVVTTMSLLSHWKPTIHMRLGSYFSHLFVDEAHHLGAPTWEAFRDAFINSHILQFTATPYRNDEKPIGGQLIFNYPLAQAQDDGYFKPINFRAVIEFDPRKRDRAIAEAAIEQLRADYDRGHILMARVRNVPRAHEVFEIYRQFPEFKPVEIHTGIKSVREREQIRQRIVNREARVIVCVDMLGEGFDLPELKIAAFHDIRQTLPITLQLAGRFTRSRPDLGNATFIANIADVEVKEELRRLYQRDVDWNQLLPLYSDKAIADEFDLFEFIGGFKTFPKQISLQNVRPAMSAVAYKTKCKEWNPENFPAGIPGFDMLDRLYSDVNPKEDTLVFLTAKRTSVDWARIDDIYSWDWQLYILFWDREQNILFIHNSSNSGFFKDLAKAVCGDDVQRIGGPTVFRCFAAVNRLRLNNVGLLEQLGRFIRFTMRAGSDVESGLTEPQKQRAIKTNLFGTGFENGKRTSLGCSYKGRIWSHQTTNLRELKQWCQAIGSKLTDISLDSDTVLEGTLRPEAVSARPTVMPIAVDWPEDLLRDMNRLMSCSFGSKEFFFHELDIGLHNPSERGELQIVVASQSHRAVVALELFETRDSTDFRFVPKQGSATAHRGSETHVLSDFFSEYPPTIWFADGSSLCGNELVKLRVKPNPYPKEKLVIWDWSDVDIKKESQGIDHIKESIQFHVIEELRKRNLAVLFDDDDSGEAADIIGITEKESSVDVEFYHCKYSSQTSPGVRIKDLYEVCGQAQKSVRWMENPTNLFSHMLAREPRKCRGKSGTRFEMGAADDLWRIREKSLRTRVNLTVLIVQPGVSAAQISRSQLELLGVTDTYLKETFMVMFGAIMSK